MTNDPAQIRIFQFIEAPAFMRFRENYIDDDGFAELQKNLAENPELGDLVPGAGGIRKLRWRDARRGKGNVAVCESSTTAFFPTKRYGY